MVKRFSSDEREAIAALNSLGWSDPKIARVLHASQHGIIAYRKRVGLAGVPSKFGQKIDDAKALSLWRAGASDGEIAREFGATQSGASRWRYRNGLERNLDPNPPLATSEKRVARNMLRLGATRRQAGDEIGRPSSSAIGRLRRSMSGPGLRKSGLSNRAIRAQVLKDTSIYPAIEAAVGKGLPPDIIRDAVDELYLEILSGRISRIFIQEQANKFRARAIRMNFGEYGSISLEEDRGGWNLKDRLEDPDALDAFEVDHDSGCERMAAL